MRLFSPQLYIHIAAFARIVSSAGIVYVTDIPIFTHLAPCAASALSYNVQYLTYNSCPPAVTALESCACTKDNNAVALASKISSAVLNSCGATASEDVASASQVFNAYCNQDTPVPTPTPSSNAVSQYVADLSAWTDLAPCARSAVSYVVQYLTYNYCPPEASALASCACLKNQNSLRVSASINSQVKNSCGATHTEDIASAQAVYSGYCGLNNGSSVFPTPSNLPGAVSYYITDLPQWSSLAPCARSGVSYPVLSQTYYDCPSQPLALVSCACVKDSNSLAISAKIVSSVIAGCGLTNSEDMTSALSVFDYYCSAGKGLVTPGGVTASVTTTANGAGTGTAKKTTTSRSAGATSTATTTGNAASSTGGLLGTTKSGVPIAAIAGSIVGAVFLLIVMLIAVCCYRRRQRHKPQTPLSFTGQPPPSYVLPTPAPDFSKQELPNNQMAIAAQPQISRKPTPAPVSPMEAKSPATVSPAVEMQAPPAPFRAEVEGGPNANAHELQHNQRQFEVPGSNQHPVELHPNGRPLHEAPGSNQRPTEMSATSGPFEMDGRHYY